MTSERHPQYAGAESAEREFGRQVAS
jgi:hypothetical protein